MTIINIISRIAVWKNGTQHQMTLYCAVTVAGEQTHKLRLSVHHVKSIIVWIACRRLTCAMVRDHPRAICAMVRDHPRAIELLLTSQCLECELLTHSVFLLISKGLLTYLHLLEHFVKSLFLIYNAFSKLG